MKHDALEKNVGLLMAFILVCVSIGGMVQIFPLIFEGKLSKPIDTLTPLTAVQLEGRDIYIREGCTVCHTQMVRPLQHETARYGHYSVAGEDAYEHPFLWGSKRTGPDLARVGGRYSDDWHMRSSGGPAERWFPTPTCPPTRGCSSGPAGRRPYGGARWKCCAPWACLTATTDIAGARGGGAAALPARRTPWWPICRAWVWTCATTTEVAE